MSPSFATRTFLAVLIARLLSLVGDQLARIALCVLVYDRTRSPTWTAVTYALTFVPRLIGSPLLSAVADRLTSRRVVIAVDVVRMVLTAAMVPAKVPLWLIIVLVAVVDVFSTPRSTAQNALLAPAGWIWLSKARLTASIEGAGIAEIIGLGAGGLLVTGVGSRGVLGIAAATFAASALVVLIGAPRSSRADEGNDHVQAKITGWTARAISLVRTDRRVRPLVVLSGVSGISITVGALAVPYTVGIGAGPVAVGLLLATWPLGWLVGTRVIDRWSARTLSRWVVPFAVLSCAPLAGCLWRLDLPATLALWLVAGIAAVYQVAIYGMFLQSTPPGPPTGMPALITTLITTAFLVFGGLGAVVAGVVTQVVAAHIVVAGVGLLGMLAAAGAGWWWHIVSKPDVERSH
jgi:predicted MFS family arabinose efflux permease